MKLALGAKRLAMLLAMMLIWTTLKQALAPEAPVDGVKTALKVYAGFLSSSGRSIGFQRSGVLSLAVPDRPDGQGLLTTVRAVDSSYTVPEDVI